MQLINLTPHPIRIYPRDTPDRISLGDVEPEHVIEPSGPPARLVQFDLGAQYGYGVPVMQVGYGNIHNLPIPSEGTFYVVALAVALAARRRTDLLAPYREVRNHDGTVIGCRMLQQIRR